MPLPFSGRFSAPARIQRLCVFALTIILLVIFLESSFFPTVSVVPALHRDDDRSRLQYYHQWGSFEPMQIPGFVNTGLPGKRSCDTLKYNSTVGIQKSFHLTDDIKQIAMSLDSHPAVDYYDDMMSDPNLKVDEIIESTWARLSGSSVWLPDQGVYLAVTRIIFCPSKNRSVPKMSFLRGQVYNADWEHLEDYNLTFGEHSFQFPLVFDIPAPWVQDGALYGPEDPRIVLEDGVEGAEPVIIFNMIAQRSDWKRAMYVFRPFTNYSTVLTIRDTERQWTEKNWAPFFLPAEEAASSNGKLARLTSAVVRKPNEYIHFIYSFKPLRILKCHLHCGDCEFVYEQSVPDNFLTQHHEDGGSLRGGTNFVPVPIPASMGLDPNVRVYASFPRTNIGGLCYGNFYRPEFVVMINIGTHFHIAFASESLDFGDAILEIGPEDDRCEKGRILIPNSVAHWDTSNGQDVMSVTFSVDDDSVQVTRVRGLLKFIWDLPQFKGLLKKDGPFKGDNSDLMNMLSSWVGDDVRGCLVEAALNYTAAAQEISHPREDDNDLDPANELMYKIHKEEELDMEDGEPRGDGKGKESLEDSQEEQTDGPDPLEKLKEAQTEGIPDLEYPLGQPLDPHNPGLDKNVQDGEPEGEEEDSEEEETTKKDDKKGLIEKNKEEKAQEQDDTGVQNDVKDKNLAEEKNLKADTNTTDHKDVKDDKKELRGEEGDVEGEEDEDVGKNSEGHAKRHVHRHQTRHSRLSP